MTRSPRGPRRVRPVKSDVDRPAHGPHVHTHRASRRPRQHLFRRGPHHPSARPARSIPPWLRPEPAKKQRKQREGDEAANEVLTSPTHHHHARTPPPPPRSGESSCCCCSGIDEQADARGDAAAGGAGGGDGGGAGEVRVGAGVAAGVDRRLGDTGRRGRGRSAASSSADAAAADGEVLLSGIVGAHLLRVQLPDHDVNGGAGRGASPAGARVRRLRRDPRRRGRRRPRGPALPPQQLPRRPPLPPHG
uniref:Uncharacterized protein n=1 Tax=Oryza punctata TaxID=4537 RepID=A0A0E0JSB0_ORYPU